MAVARATVLAALPNGGSLVGLDSVVTPLAALFLSLGGRVARVARWHGPALVAVQPCADAECRRVSEGSGSKWALSTVKAAFFSSAVEAHVYSAHGATCGAPAALVQPRIALDNRVHIHDGQLEPRPESRRGSLDVRRGRARILARGHALSP